MLFGRNSSGKSALIRALLLLKQSLESRDADAPLIFSGSMVDLGSYYNAVHLHQVRRDITFGFRVSRPKFEEPQPQREQGETEEGFDKRQKKYESRIEAYRSSGISQQWSLPDGPSVDVDDDRVDLELTFGRMDDLPTPVLKRLVIYGWRSPEEKERERVLVFSFTRQQDGRWHAESDMPLNYSREEDEGEDRKTVPCEQFSDELWKGLVPDTGNGCIPRRLWLLDADRPRPGDRTPDWEMVDTALEFFWNHLTQVIGGLSYLPPLRDEPRRYYRADHGWVHELRKTDSEKRAQVNQWLSSAAINAEVYAKPLGDDDKEGIVAVYLREGASLHTNLRDVGSGVSQVLPVIVGSLQAPEGGLIIVEQPELHLHPSAQAELADVFLELAQRNNSMCLLETHSSSIINRIRRRVAGGRIRTSDISLLFVRRNNNTSVCTHVSLRSNGDYGVDSGDLMGFFAADTNELTLMRTADVSEEEATNIEKTRQKLKRYEHLFDGESVDVMFAILGLHTASAIRMMRVWAEFVTKKIASEKGIKIEQRLSFDEVISRLVAGKFLILTSKDWPTGLDSSATSNLTLINMALRSLRQMWPVMTLSCSVENLA